MFVTLKHLGWGYCACGRRSMGMCQKQPFLLVKSVFAPLTVRGAKTHLRIYYYSYVHFLRKRRKWTTTTKTRDFGVDSRLVDSEGLPLAFAIVKQTNSSQRWFPGCPSKLETVGTQISLEKHSNTPVCHVNDVLDMGEKVSIWRLKCVFAHFRRIFGSRPK